MTVSRVGNRDVGLAVALIAAAIGVVAGEPTLLLAATIGLVYAAFEWSSSPPEPNLEIERSVVPRTPLPGDDVEVAVTVSNHGERALPDVRIVDGVPDRLGVVDGSPRFGTALGPGEDRQLTYTISARRGSHTFDETILVCRSLAGDTEFRETVDVGTVIDCSATVEDVPTGTETLPYAGRIETDSAGEGVTFHSVREFQSTDSMSRVDWKRFARTNELTTIEYEATRTASFVVLVDTRVNFAPTDRAPTATEYVRYAAERIGTALLDDNQQVGAALFDAGTYLRPGSSQTQLLRFRTLVLQGRHPDQTNADAGLIDGFDSDRFFSGALDRDAVADGGRRAGLTTDGSGTHRDRDVRKLDRRFPDGAQIVFCTPMMDQRAANAARRLAAYGREVTVVSPDVTSTETPGNTVERITRTDRVRSLRGTVHVVDWEPTQPLPKALARAKQRWSR